MGTELKPTKREFRGADGNKLQIRYRTYIPLISAWGQQVRGKAYILEGAQNNLLGKPEIRAFELVKTVRSVSKEILESHPKLFNKLGVLPDVFKIHMREGATPLCLNVPRRLPMGLRKATKDELDRMESLGVIEKVERPTTWCSGMVVAPKSNGKVRICVDLTQLNKSVLRETYPLPHLEDTLASLEGSQYFSKMDANSGFWQIDLAEESREFTTFITPFGRYQYKKMPFGISAAPEFFQRQMNKILDGLTGVVCMMDDILVVGKTKEEHDSRLATVLSKVEAAGMTLNKDKCAFGVTEVKFLGHVLSKKGIKVDPEKEKAIREMPPPKDRKGLQRFLAMVNYLSRFSPLLSEAEVPLRELDKQSNDWVWLEIHQQSFDRVKEIITSSPLLALFDFNKEHRVTADASCHTLGAALLQNQGNGEWVPVAYASRKLTDAERRYGQIEKEALAITWACEKFDFYLVGRQFEVETDHKPLIPLLGSKDLSELPLRIQRFKMRLMRYCYQIFHTPGSKMFIADLLSRPPTEKEIKRIDRVEMHVNSLVTAEDDALVKEIRRQAEQDDNYKAIVKAIREGWPGNPKGEMRVMRGNADVLSEKDGLIFMNSRMFIPAAMRKDMLDRLHSGHQGIVKTYRRSQDSVWWPTIRREIMELVEFCPKCIKHRRMRSLPLKQTELPDKPWSVIASDLFEFEGKSYALFVDYYSRWIEVIEMRGQTGAELARKFRPVIARLGAPDKIRTDNGPCYASPEWRALMEEFNVQHVTSSPHHHESNGLAERGVETVKGLWKKEADKNKALLAYRTTPLESNYRPDELLLGRRLKNELPLQHQNTPSQADFKKRDRHLKQRQKRNFDKGRKVRDEQALEQGQLVWIKINHDDQGKKGIVKYQAEEPNSYWIETDKRLVRRTRKHLRPLPMDDELDKSPSKAGKGKVSKESSSKARDLVDARAPSTRRARKKQDPNFVYF